MWWDRVNFVELMRLWTVMVTPPYFRSALNNDWISGKDGKEQQQEQDNSDIHMNRDEKRELAKLINTQTVLIKQIDNLKDELETQTKAMQRLRRSKDL